MIAVGIDPGTGRTSPTGLFIFDEESGAILYYGEFYPTRGFEHSTIVSHIRDVLLNLKLGFPESQLNIGIETFVMRGKAGQMLQRLIGACLSEAELHGNISEVYNTTVKKLVGGHGRADKQQVAEGVRSYFMERPASLNMVETFIENKKWDILDAAAIAITGLHAKQKKGQAYSID